ncbi:hypothetical protein VTK73DRAFT_2740 [Phialemonium thermophilum]|uniref:Anamorsin homolog n=1 Tax=Phialemonium thermophilum TaxID=223376 RepID=A0ABR3Y2B0_9PEZI
MNGAGKRNLLLAPPSIASHEETLHDVFATFDRSASDLQMLDRLSAGLVALPPATYDLVLVLTGKSDTWRSEAAQLLTRDVLAAIVPSLKIGGRFQMQDGLINEVVSREAILAGLVNTGGVFEKVQEEEVVIPLRLGAKRRDGAGVHGNSVGTVVTINNLDDLGDYSYGDELIDEDNLLSEEDLKRPPQQPPANCEPEVARKRRRPCKDCTCGLADRLEAEDEARRQKAAQGLNILKLKSDDLTELDFTVKGKTGSCNSCSLGDAFRCATCPYIGLPPFKPGQEVQILNDVVQL